jgi:hypothetical protein
MGGQQQKRAVRLGRALCLSLMMAGRYDVAAASM